MTKNVLITGANAGLGFDVARQLALSGRWSSVILTARSAEKAGRAIQQLVELTGREVFRSVVFDNNKPETIRDAVAKLAERDQKLDAVILNAGGMGRVGDDGLPLRTELGFTEMFSMNVGGHAVFVEGLVNAGLLPAGATVMFAGSEASRGIKKMGVPVPTLPEGLGDLDSTLSAVVRGSHASKEYDPQVDYGLVKLIGTAWMKDLAERHSLRALTVSPGFTAGTEGLNKAPIPLPLKLMFKWVMLPLMRLTGNAHNLEVGAARFVQALEDDALKAGLFYASAPKRISGPLVQQTGALQPLLDDTAFYAAVGRLIDREVSAQAAA